MTVALSSGLGSQFSFSPNESSYGTTTTTTVFPRVTAGSLVRAATRVQGEGIQSGVFGPLGSQYAEATSAGTGTIDMEVQTKSMLGLFELLMGGSSSAQQAATTAYLHTFTLADPVGKYRTMQVGRPTRGGTVVPATLAGCKIPRASFSIGQSENLMASFEVDGQSWDNTTSLAAASYTADSLVFGFQTLDVKMGTYASESSVSGVRGVNWDIDRPMDTEDYTAGSSGLKSEPVINDRTNLSGTLSVDWLAKATFEDLAAGMAGTSLVIECTGALIEDTYYDLFRMTVPGVYFESGSQGVDGPAELVSDWNWVWRYDGTNMPVIEVVSTETSVA